MAKFTSGARDNFLFNLENKKWKEKHKRPKSRKGKLRFDFEHRKIEKWGSYRQYLKSRAFKVWKLAVLEKAKHKCYFCGQKAETAHHLRYRKWGTERIEDGIAVCNHCHRNKAHAGLRLDEEYSKIR